MYELLYKVYYNELASYIFSLNKNKQQAEDIVQNVMLNIWKNRHLLKIETSLKSYLYKASYYEFITLYNSQKRELIYINSAQKNALDVFSEDDSDVIQNKVKKVQEAIDKLPPKCKEIFILNKFKGLRYQEVADNLNISIKTVEAQMSKALSRIKKEIKTKKTA